MQSRRFSRELAALDGIFDFATGFFAAEGLPPPAAADVQLVLEELFTNMVKYSPGGAHEIEIQLDWQEPTLTATLYDSDVRPFDVSRPPDVNASSPAKRSRPGGLGLRLVHRIAERVRYEYRDRTSIITVTMRP